MHINFQNKSVKRVTNHVLFWATMILVFGVFGTIVSTDYHFTFNYYFRILLIDLIVLPTDFLGVYFTIYYLLPRFLFKRKYFLFALFFILFFIVLLIITLPIEYLAIRRLSFNEMKYDLITFSKYRWLWDMVVKLMIIGLATSIKSAREWLKYFINKQEVEKQRIETELRLKEAELKLLKAQIHPHFLFNTLNNLYGLTLKKSDRAPEIVLKISELLDYILYKCNAKKVPLINEINQLKNYVELEKLRYDEKLSVSFNVTGNPEGKDIAPLILLPFIENCFKHGTSHLIERKWILINIEARESACFISISNSKSKDEPTTKQDYTEGVGLNNVRRRLELSYKNKHELLIYDEDDRFRVDLVLENN